MPVPLTPEQKPFARRAIEAGRLRSEDEAVQEALALWEERERRRAEFLATIDDAKASRVAQASGSIEVAGRLVDSITDRFSFWAGSPIWGGPATTILVRMPATLLSANT